MIFLINQNSILYHTTFTIITHFDLFYSSIKCRVSVIEIFFFFEKRKQLIFVLKKLEEFDKIEDSLKCHKRYMANKLCFTIRANK